MLIVSARLKGISPISFSAPIQSPKKEGEKNDAYEERTWRERAHVNAQGFVFIPPTALKNCLSEMAKYRSDSVPGMGKKTYTAFVEAGIMVTDPIILLDAKGTPVKPDRMGCDHLFVPADGKRGGGKRVWKKFPVLNEWSAEVTFYILEQVLINDIKRVQSYLEQAGKFIGMGRFRPRNNGFYGRWTVEHFETVEEK